MLAVASLALEVDPHARLFGAIAAGGFGVAAGSRLLLESAELRGLRERTDRLILTGDASDSSELVHWRVEELVAPDTRRGFAREIERLLRRLDPARLPSASPLRRVVARQYETRLRGLEVRMLDERPVAARGMLRLRWLLRDPGSPLYDEAHERQLGRAITRVWMELEP